MAVTRSTAESRGSIPRSGGGAKPLRVGRAPELVWLLVVAMLVSCAWWMVYTARVRRDAGPVQPVNLAEARTASSLEPALTVLRSPADRAFAAKQILDLVQVHEGHLPNTGAIARLRVNRAVVAANRSLEQLRTRAGEGAGDTMALFTPAEFALVKQAVAVRPMSEFRGEFLKWAGIVLGAFLLTHLVWSLGGFGGHWVFLPLLLLLTGIGFTLMLALRDPVRDLMIFVPYAQGVAAGCLVMLAASFVNWESATAGFSFVPLVGAAVLSVALMLFGTAPGASDARVNLGPVQPAEAIKILLVFFLAGYFAKRWPLLRQLKEKRVLLPGVELPRLEYAAPVVVGVLVSLLFFYLQKDLGPALVFAAVFLTMYGIARNRAALAALGMGALFGGFLIGYFLGVPHTVHDRVAMWISPWGNSVRGGDQVVHSLWALGSGGLVGTGLGLGEPDVIPAGHTDLIVSVLGEEWGFLGIVLVYGALALLVWLSLRIARRARTDYTFFLALGLTLLLAAEVLLISAGILGLFPLSGVVTPFLSFGRTAMLANFFIAGVLLAIGNVREGEQRTVAFHGGLRWVEFGLAAALLLVVGRAGWVQLAQADAFAGKGALVLQADGGRRFVYNPRLIAAARTLQRGSIYDRTGLPLATSAWDELEKHRREYAGLGIDIDKTCNRADSRHYPLGGLTFHILGDLRTRANWGAPNSSLIERDHAKRLQGYDDRARIMEVTDAAGKLQLSVQYDYRELLPLLRRRWQPEHPEVKALMDRERNVHLSIHAGLQVSAGQILKTRLAEQGLTKGSMVAMDPETGDLLASVNWPSPEANEERLAVGEAAGPMLDRARYGLYPPGSTFKIVTAIAALRADPALASQHFDCVRLPDGRTGNFIGNSKRPIRDDAEDKTPHGSLDMHRAIVVSCNAYFAQLGALKVGAAALLETSKLLGISVANPMTVANLKPQLPQISYGQGQVVVTPFQMARVAAAVAGGGRLPMGRWVLDENNARNAAPVVLLDAKLAAALGRDMRGVVTSGTGKKLAGIDQPIAGKTGTAELANAPSHGWFIGFAPYAEAAPVGTKRIAFAVLAENGHYGGTSAAPLAGDLVAAAKQLKLIQ